MPVTDWIWRKGKSFVFAFLLLAGVQCCVVRSASAQQVTIRIVNGSDGRPIINKCMYVGVGDKHDPTFGSWFTTQTDRKGTIILHLASEHQVTTGISEQLTCGLIGMKNLTTRYADTITIRTGYALCLPGKRDFSWLIPATFATEEVLQSGVVTANTCGAAVATRTPGEIVLFVRPLTLWEKLRS